MEITDLDIEDLTIEQLVRVIAYAVREQSEKLDEVLEKLDNLNNDDPELLVYGS
jgi:hypothetical protein